MTPPPDTPAGARLSEEEIVTLVHGFTFDCPTCGHGYTRHLSTKPGCKDCPGLAGTPHSYEHPGACPETMTTALGRAIAPAVERILAERLAAHDAPGLAEAALREAVETQAAVWSAPESHRNGAWLRERDAADILRTLLAAHPPTAPEPSAGADGLAGPSDRCGYSVPGIDGNEEPCDRPAVGWRWYQDTGLHEDLLDAACHWHANEGGQRIHEAEAERDRLRAVVERVEALAWFGDEDEEVAHVAACQDFGCKTCVVIACATDLRAALDGAGQ